MSDRVDALAAFDALIQEFGTWSVGVAETKCLAPSQALVDRMRAMRHALASRRAVTLTDETDCPVGLDAQREAARQALDSLIAKMEVAQLSVERAPYWAEMRVNIKAFRDLYLARWYPAPAPDRPASHGSGGQP